MSEFSEYIDNYMNENSISSSSLAIDLDMDRALIHRYRKGTRVPSDEQTVCDIAGALRMNTLEKRILFEKYDLVSMGESVVYNYKYVIKLLEDLQTLEKEHMNLLPEIGSFNFSDKDNSVINLSSKEEIIALCADLFSTAPEKQNVKIQMVLQPIYDEILTLIKRVLNSSENIKVEHIVCLEKNAQKNFMNLEIFGKIIPLVLGNVDYNAFYYYDSIINHINEMSLFPNVIIMNDIVVQFDFDMQSGVAIYDKVYSEHMKNKYNRFRDLTEVLLIKSERPLDFLDIYNNIHETTTTAYSLYAQPCLGYCSSTDMFEKYLVQIPHREEFIKGMAYHLGNWENMNFIPPESFCKKIYSYCKISGVRSFMETGRVDELPEALYSPLDKEVRIKMLERLIHLVKADIVNCIFVDEDMPLSKSVYFYWNDAKQVFFHKLGSLDTQQVCINASGMYQSIQDFLCYVNKKMIKKKDETLEVLEGIWREYW
ncbi:MAG: hypothetical protein E7265_10100 [Lachnospiraceae bacterium]|nr:hypothetical protein [Lachnospiraceae bacterium]